MNMKIPFAVTLAIFAWVVWDVTHGGLICNY
jgi:hypothetical protein